MLLFVFVDPFCVCLRFVFKHSVVAGSRARGGHKTPLSCRSDAEQMSLV